jgi:microcompartment protein CcmL/EutN
MVELTGAGAAVRLATPEAVTACTNLGHITASVVHKVGFIPRHPDAVQDNINVTARNSAAGMGGDTIVPASKVEEGKQTFDVYRCARR